MRSVGAHDDTRTEPSFDTRLRILSWHRELTEEIVIPKWICLWLVAFLQTAATRLGFDPNYRGRGFLNYVGV